MGKRALGWRAALAFATSFHSLLRANAPVQLRAVGPTGVELVAISISIQALNRNDFLESRARQLQRTLARSLEEADTARSTARAR